MMNEQSLLDAMDGVALLLDRDLVIRRVGRPNWNRVWMENGGAPDHPDVTGQRLTDCISADEVKRTWEQVLDDVLQRRRPHVQLDYRCDAPDWKRYMRLAVTPVLTGGEVSYLLYQSSLLHEEPRAPVGYLASPAFWRDGLPLLRICSVCARVAWHPEGATGTRWLDAVEYYRAGGDDDVNLSHGFCPPCSKALLEGLSARPGDPGDHG